MGLGLACHDKKTVVGQGKLVFVGMIIARPKYKLARRAQAQRCNDRLGAQLPFVITVPANPICPFVFIEIAAVGHTIYLEHLHHHLGEL